MFQPKFWINQLFFSRLLLSFLSIGVCSLVIVSNVNAAAIGLPELTAKFGLGTKVSQVYVNDAEGHTSRITSTQPSSIYVSDWLTEGSRYLAEAYMTSYAFEANSQTVGQQVSQNGLRFSVQANKILNKYFAPWLGAGVDLSYSSFNKRHTVDEEGFLLEHFSDVKKPGLGFILNVMETWSVNSYFDVAAKLEYSAPITQSVNGFSAGIIFLFRPVL